jgi:hypothetical protein
VEASASLNTSNRFLEGDTVFLEILGSLLRIVIEAEHAGFLS